MATASPAGDRDLDAPTPRRPAQCPVEDWLSFLGHRWTALVLWHLRDGELRHGDLAQRLPGITPKVLGERLDGLCRRGIVDRIPVGGFPRGVAYRLSDRGAGLIDVLDGIELWSRRP